MNRGAHRFDRRGDSSPALEGRGALLHEDLEPVGDTLATRFPRRGNQCRRFSVGSVGEVHHLLAQGAASFERWTGIEAPLDVMRAALGFPA